MQAAFGAEKPKVTVGVDYAEGKDKPGFWTWYNRTTQINDEIVAESGNVSFNNSGITIRNGTAVQAYIGTDGELYTG
jgi:hypothetical protein